MNLLDRLLGHDAWTTRQLLQRCSDLSDEKLDREFDIGHRSLRATFAHTIHNVEVWARLMDGLPLDNLASSQKPQSIVEMTERLDQAADHLAAVARAVASRDGWDELWTDHADDPPTKKSFGGAIAHVITHSMHHRAQLLYLMRMVGVEDRPEGDVLSWEDQLHQRIEGSKDES